jgi:hypothetical protein
MTHPAPRLCAALEIACNAGVCVPMYRLARMQAQGIFMDTNFCAPALLWARRQLAFFARTGILPNK